MGLPKAVAPTSPATSSRTAFVCGVRAILSTGTWASSTPREQAFPWTIRGPSERSLSAMHTDDLGAREVEDDVAQPQEFLLVEILKFASLEIA